MKEKLSQFHVAILIYMIQTGTVIITLPRLLAQNFGTNGWLALVLVSVIISLNLLLISGVYQLGKGKSIFEILEKSIPKLILYPFYFTLATLWALIGCFVGKQYILIFKMIAFPTTNPMILKLVLVVLAFFLIIKNVYNISKAATVFFWFITWMLILMFYFYNDFQFSRLTPFVFKEADLSINGFFTIYIAFLGYELCLLLFPYTNKKTKLMRAAQIGNLMVTLSYLYICFIAFGFYGHEHLKTLQFPLLNMMAYIQFPFIQGTENLLYAFLMFSIIITSVMYWWSARVVIQRVFSINNKAITIIILAFSFGISFFSDSLNHAEKWLAILGFTELGVAYLLPVCLIVILLIQGKRGEPSE
ncbi:spore gernimation protein [Paenibacillus sp. FSL H8-0548]|nr:spore gernimation protein [Paenibacillus sp. FSL H8-0548]